MTEMLAATLLILRLIGVAYLVRVLKIQIKLLRKPIDDPEIWDFRRTLHYITVALTVGNLVPIILDSLVVLQGIGKLDYVRTRPVLLVYAGTNAVIALLAAIMIHKLYRLAADTKIVTDLERSYLNEKRKKRE